VGIVASDDVSAKEDRCVVVGSEGGKPKLLSASYTWNQEKITTAWIEDRSLSPNGPDAPVDFRANSCICLAISKKNAMGQMLSKKSKADLVMLFSQFDADDSGDLGRDEIAELAKSLGKKLTKKELETAMKEMDEDESGEVDFEEFFRWWNIAYEKARLGDVIAVLQCVNKEAGVFSAAEAASIETFADAVEHTITAAAVQAEYSMAMENDAYLASFRDPKQLRSIEKSSSIQRQTASAEVLDSEPTTRSRASTFSGRPSERIGRPRRRYSQEEMQVSSLLDGLNLPDIEELGKWSFPCLDYTVEQLTGCVLMMFQQRGVLEEFHIADDALMNFTAEEKRYRMRALAWYRLPALTHYICIPRYSRATI